MYQLQIIVYANVSAFEQRNKLFERIVEVNGSVYVDFEVLLKSLKFMYGDSSVISFNAL